MSSSLNMLWKMPTSWQRTDRKILERIHKLIKNLNAPL